MKKLCYVIIFSCFAFFAMLCCSKKANAEDANSDQILSSIYEMAIKENNEINDYYDSLLDDIEEDWLIEDELGRMKWNISSDEINDIDQELVSFLNCSIEEKNTLIDDGIICQEDGDIELIDEVKGDYFIQSGDISFKQRYKKIWKISIWIGFDIICNNPKASITLATIGVLLDLVGIITDISILWKNVDVAVGLAKTYCYSLHTIVKELGALLQGVPSYILTGVEFMWKTIVVGGGGVFSLIISALKFGFPKTIDAFKIIQHASNGGGVTFRYTAIIFKKYILN